MEYILEIEKLGKNYSDFTLDDLSFSIPQGTIMGLIGKNGAGKTTTINLILNEIAKDSGSIKVFREDHLECEKEIKDRIGVVFDESHLPDMFSPNEIENFMKSVYFSWQTKMYHSYLNRFQLPANKPVKNFSKGMELKLNFALALSHNPQLLILDEATGGLDPIMRDEILDILLDFVQDETHAILFSSHITTDLERIADYVTFIHEGKLLFSKSKDELIYKYGIIKCGAEHFNCIDKNDIIAYRKRDYEWQVLIADKEKAQRKYKKYIIDNATIDDIMLFYVKGEEK
jgi:ABC-2 type transport system ATP-binding protein